MREVCQTLTNVVSNKQDYCDLTTRRKVIKDTIHADDKTICNNG